MLEVDACVCCRITIQYLYKQRDKEGAVCKQTLLLKGYLGNMAQVCVRTEESFQFLQPETGVSRCERFFLVYS